MNLFLFRKYINIIFKKNNKFIYYSKNLKFHTWFYTFILIFSKKNVFRSKLFNDFSKIIGDGYSLGYASGRMGFFHILKSLNLSSEDEVILQAPNCAVMYNAVIRNGAIPVVVDVDLNCLGSDISNIQIRITNNTKVIVVQHTLGIPCNIKSIASFCAENNIILIEDCALTVSSSFDNIILGNFGDYAIFSFDNTKPINAIIGGIVYSKEKVKIAILEKDNYLLPELSKTFRFFILCNAFVNKIFSKRFNWFYNLIYHFSLKILSIVKFKYKFPFLYNDSDYCLDNNDFSYPYPSKMSECFAYLAHISLKNWQETVDRRIANKDKLLSIVRKFKIGIVPSAYYSINLNVVPLRLAIFVQRDSFFFNLLDKTYDKNLMWFISPLACNEDYEKFRINDAMIPNCIELNNRIINIPVDDSEEVDRLIKLIEYIYE